MEIRSLTILYSDRYVQIYSLLYTATAKKTAYQETYIVEEFGKSYDSFGAPVLRTNKVVSPIGIVEIKERKWNMEIFQ